MRLAPIIKTDCTLHGQICNFFALGAVTKKRKAKASDVSIFIGIFCFDKNRLLGVGEINTYIFQYNAAGRVLAWKVIDTSSQLWWLIQTHSLNIAVTSQLSTLLDHQPDM